MIKNETFYRAECDVLKCGNTIPNEDDHEASHWPLWSVEEALREPREVGSTDVEVTWFYDGEQTLCPQHHPEARPCGTCDGQGAVRVPGPPPNLREGAEWCHWIGYHPAPPVQTNGSAS